MRVGGRWPGSVAAIAAVAACAASPGPRAAHSALPVRALPPVDRALIVDEGVFALTVRQAPAGSETFTILRRPADGGYEVRSETQLTAGSLMRLLDARLITDAGWRPREARVRDVRDGGTVTTLDGDPLRVSVSTAGAPATVTIAPAAVDLFIADSTNSHYAPLCAAPSDATVIAFPAMQIAIRAEIRDPATPVIRRDVDLGGAVRVQIYCDGARLIEVAFPVGGFTATRIGYAGDYAAVRPAEHASPVRPAGVSELARAVAVRARPHADAATLACTLTVPSTHAERTRRDRSQALPAVVLITGSGAQDRDENTVGPGGLKMSSFRVLAYALGAAGIASLRCDDRGTGASTGEFGTATLDTFVGDATAMVAALRGEPAIDPARIGLVGHSEGGVIAPLVARRDRRLAAIALLAAPGRPLDVVLAEQVANTLRRTGASEADRAAALANHRAAFAAIAAGQPLPATTEAREWAGAEAWLASHLAHDPASTAAALDRVAVLIAQGDTDQQVGVADAEALRDAFARAGNRRVTYRRYPHLNHMFAASETGDLSEYADPGATLDPGFVADLVGFLAAL